MSYSQGLENSKIALQANVGCMPLRYEHLLDRQLDQRLGKPSSLSPNQLLEVFEVQDFSLSHGIMPPPAPVNYCGLVLMNLAASLFP